jgi:hypothetical protein
MREKSQSTAASNSSLIWGDFSASGKSRDYVTAVSSLQQIGLTGVENR